MIVFLLILTVGLMAWLLLRTIGGPKLRWLTALQSNNSNTKPSGYEPYDAADLPPQFQLQSGFDASFAPPDALPIKTRQHFFVLGESNLYAELVATLAGSSYRVFPNVRLNDIFQITKDESSKNLSHLHQQSVSFLIVETPEFRPILGLMLEGQAYGDVLETKLHSPLPDPKLVALAFRSARLPLLCIEAKRNIDADGLQKLLAPHFSQS